MTELNVYLWLKLDIVRCGLEALGLFIIVGAILYVAVSNSFKSGVFWLFLVAILFIALGLMIPSTAEYAVIKVLPKISNSEIVSEIPQNVKEMYQMTRDYFKNKLSYC